MVPMPELQHEEGPQEIAVERGVVVFVEPEQLIHRAAGEVAALEALPGQERVPRQLAKRRVAAEPAADGQPKAVLDLGQGGGGKQARESALEEVALFRSTDLVPCGKRAGEVHQTRI